MIRAPVKHCMGRRLHGWDYKGRGIYMITVVVAGRRPLLGRLVKRGGAWEVEETPLGREVARVWLDLPRLWPGVDVKLHQVMPDHFHGMLYVREAQPKPLGNIIASFKARISSYYLAASGEAQNFASFAPGRSRPGFGDMPGASSAPGRSRPGLWEPGFVDLVLKRRGQLESMAAYVRDNPRRLGVKRENPPHPARC